MRETTTTTTTTKPAAAGGATSRGNQLLAILHADMPRFICPDSGRAVSPMTAKMVLVVVAMHPGSCMTLRQLAWLCGIAYSVVIYAVVVLLDRGLLLRVEPNNRAPTLPSRWRGKTYAYEVNWRAVLDLPRKDLTPPSAAKPDRGVSA